MDKEQLKTIIADELRKIGLSPEINQGADITVDQEFLDAKWSTGKQKIEYHNSAYLNQEDQILYYWEKTKEVGSGFSFGTDTESSFQSGKTLFRKVKSVQYGPDGKAYEYELDLGQIPKIYKETAKNNGWKFKLVIKKDKAHFPQGYTPVSSGNE